MWQITLPGCRCLQGDGQEGHLREKPSALVLENDQPSSQSKGPGAHMGDSIAFLLSVDFKIIKGNKSPLEGYLQKGWRGIQTQNVSLKKTIKRMHFKSEKISSLF